MFGAEVSAAAQAHARAEWPKESVGLVIGGAYRPVQNIADHPETEFAFHPRHLLDGEVQAVIHSHPHGNHAPSLEDMQQQIAMAIPWGIVAASEEDARDVFWWGPGVPLPPLIGRQYRFGPSGSDGRGDCYAVIRDWFALNRDQTLKEVPRDAARYRAETPWYDTLFDSYGWKEIQPNEVDVGDVVLMRIRQRVTNHAMLYIGQGLALHHMEAQLSAQVPIGPWLRFRTRCLRYQGGAQ